MWRKMSIANHLFVALPGFLQLLCFSLLLSMNDHPHKLDGIHDKPNEGKQQFLQGFMQPLQEFAHSWQTANKGYVTDDWSFESMCLSQQLTRCIAAIQAEIQPKNIWNKIEHTRPLMILLNEMLCLISLYKIIKFAIFILSGRCGKWYRR